MILVLFRVSFSILENPFTERERRVVGGRHAQVHAAHRLFRGLVVALDLAARLLESRDRRLVLGPRRRARQEGGQDGREDQPPKCGRSAFIVHLSWGLLRG